MNIMHWRCILHVTRKRERDELLKIGEKCLYAIAIPTKNIVYTGEKERKGRQSETFERRGVRESEK